MLWPLLIMALGFTLLFVTLLLVRMRTALIAAQDARAPPRARSIARAQSAMLRHRAAS